MNTKQKRVLVSVPFTREQFAQLACPEGVGLTYAECPGERDTAEITGWIGEPTPQQAEQAKQLEWIQIPSAGVDGYLRHGAYPAGITMTTASGAFGASMAEYALAMVLSLYKGLPVYRDHQRAQVWQSAGRQQSLRGKHLLVLGTGDVGTQTARHFRPFVGSVTGLRRNHGKTPEGFDRVIYEAELDEALPQADILVSTLPGTAETANLMNARRLNLLNRDAVVVNVGRGVVFDQDALTRRLMEHTLWGAALDVTVPEPLSEGHPLWQLDNVILTPHISGKSFGHLESITRRILAIVNENLSRYAEGRPLKNQVDFSLGYRIMEYRE